MGYPRCILQTMRLFVIHFLFVVLLFGCEDDSPSIPATVDDVDGNVYHTVVIGSQVWMLENLKVSKYNNGEDIMNLTDPAKWDISTTTGAWCYYNNDASLNNDYGKLYNWYAVKDPRKLSPNGWHVPTDDEWVTLSDQLGGFMSAGGKMKEKGTGHWAAPNAGATNESGFTALPGGTVGYGSYNGFGTNGWWWSSTKNDIGIFSANYIWLGSLDGMVNFNDANKENGFCVRCLKD